MGEALRGSWLGSQEGTRRLGIQPTIWGTMVSYSDIASSKDSDILLPAYITPINLSPAVYCRIGYGVGGLGQSLLHPRLTVDGARGESAESGEKHTRDTEAPGDWREIITARNSSIYNIDFTLPRDTTPCIDLSRWLKHPRRGPVPLSGHHGQTWLFFW